MKLNNYEVFNYAQALNTFSNNKDLYIPVKANFIIQKNLQALVTAGEHIEKSRFEIIQHYGVLNEEKGQYIVPAEKIDEANAELSVLFEIEQDLDLGKIKIEDLGNIELTTTQMQALMFMIEE